MSRLTRDGTAEPVSQDQILRHARGQGNINFPCSADHEQDWQPYPVDPYSAICDDHTYIHTYCSGYYNPQGSQVARKGNSGTKAKLLQGLEGSSTRRSIKIVGEICENRSSMRRCRSWVSSQLALMAALVSLRSGACQPGTQTGEFMVTVPVGSVTSKIPDRASRVERIDNWVAAVLSVEGGNCSG